MKGQMHLAVRPSETGCEAVAGGRKFAGARHSPISSKRISIFLSSRLIKFRKSVRELKESLAISGVQGRQVTDDDDP